MDLPIVFYTTLPMTLPTVLPTALSMILPTVLTMVLPTGLPIVSSLVPDTTYIILPVLLSPYPNTSLPFYFHCIIDIEFTYHLLLYHNHSDWIKTILPILQLLISSFHLKYTFLFSYCDTKKFLSVRRTASFCSISDSIVTYLYSSRIIQQSW